MRAQRFGRAWDEVFEAMLSLRPEAIDPRREGIEVGVTGIHGPRFSKRRSFTAGA
jgi:hypothetical protein